MRPVDHGDVSAAARALLMIPDPARPMRIARLLREAEIADDHRRRTGWNHPVWGNGSLMSAALRMARREEPSFEDADYVRCWMLVFDALMTHRSR